MKSQLARFEDLSDIFITFGRNPTNMANIPVIDCFFLNYVIVHNSCAYKPRQILQIVNFKDTKRAEKNRGGGP